MWVDLDEQQAINLDLYKGIRIAEEGESCSIVAYDDNGGVTLCECSSYEKAVQAKDRLLYLIRNGARVAAVYGVNPDLRDYAR